MAHERLADVVDAVVCMAAEVWDADIVHVVPQDFSQHTQAMQVVICAQLAEITAPVSQLDWILSSVQLSHLLCSEAEVVVFEEMAPCLFYLRAWLPSILGLKTETSIE